MLINDILETLPDPFVLVLDDLHLVSEPAVYTALDYLLERLPPQMHLMAATRHDPPLALARLRGRGALAELRLPDLRFTLDEAAAFLNTQRLGLSPEDLASLHSRTEGWAVGLRLLADSLNRIPTRSGRSAFITYLAQTDRYVFDFLADEVLSRQSSAVRTFLLETSILPELTPALCQAVTGRADALAILEDLYRRNLFLVAVDDGRWTTDDGPQTTDLIRRPSSMVRRLSSVVHRPIYRYHALFAEFLRRRLTQEMPERLVELHARAAQAETVPARAIAHYLAAQLWEPAAQAMGAVSQ